MRMRRVASLIVMFVLSATLAFAQSRVVTGTVTDEKGDPIAFASIKVKNGKGGVAADANGNFRIEVQDGTVLVISAAGSQNKEVTVSGNQTTINVSLVKGSTELSSVVVSALGVRRSVKSTPYAAQTVSAARLTQTREPDITNALAGKVAGIQVVGQAGSKLGSTGGVRIRGVGGLGDVNAIYVVDGTILNNVTDINLDDVENITVLKGRSATALYGTRATGGVILITTKKGRRNSKGVDVEFNQTTTFERVSTLPNYQNSYMGGGASNWQTFKYTPGVNPTEWSVFDGKKFPDYADDASWGPKIDGTEYIPWYAWYPGSPYSFKTANATPQPNNIHDFYDNGFFANNNLNISKGWDKVTARVGYTYMNHQGILPYSSQIKHLISTQEVWDITKNLSFSVNANYSNELIKGDFNDAYSNQTSGSFNQWFHRDIDINILRELQDFRTPIGTLVSWNHANPGTASTSTTGGYLKGNYWYNHYSFLKNNKQDNRRERIYGNASLRYKIMKDWDITGTYRLNYRTTKFEAKVPFIIENSAAQSGILSSYQNDDTKYTEHNIELISTYKKTFGDFSLDALAGGNYLTWKQRDSSRITAGGLSTPDLFEIANSSSDATLDATYSDYKIASGFARATLGYKDFLFLDGSYRLDVASNLPVKNNAFSYGALGVSYVFTDQLKSVIPALSFGKLRTAVATAGDNGINTYLLAYATNLVYTRNNVPYNNYYLSSVPNTNVDPNVKAAKTTEYEAGLETRFFRDKLGLNLTLFMEKRKDEIVRTQVSTASGFGLYTFNAGEVTRKGIELQTDFKPIQTKSFSWDITFNWSTYNSFVNKISEETKILLVTSPRTSSAPQFNGIPLPQVYHIEGQNWGQLRGVGIKRINGLPVLNADGTYQTESNVLFGSVIPNYTGGVFNQFSYKALTLAFSLDFQQGGKYFSLSDFWGTYSGLYAKTAATNDRGKNVRDAVADGGGVHVYGVREDGKPYDAYVEGYDYFHQNANSGGIADMSIFDASYIKVREVSLGYTLPVSKWGWKWAKSAFISVVARNPWLIYATNPDFDPSEISQTYGEAGQLPGVRSLGVNLKFRF
jgi:TonB-linked SusC/RagA family outer membrane protein